MSDAEKADELEAGGKAKLGKAVALAGVSLKKRRVRHFVKFKVELVIVRHQTSDARCFLLRRLIVDQSLFHEKLFDCVLTQKRAGLNGYN
jgi:hypothetical protein